MQKRVDIILKEKQFVFIIGAPRSGTTWLQGMLGSHPSICTTTELKLFDFYISPLIKSWNTNVELNEHSKILSGLTTFWTEKDFYNFLTEFIERIYTLVLSTKPQAQIILDKTPAYSLNLEHIERIIPNAKYIHIIRDGRDVAVSLNAASTSWGSMWAPKDVEKAAVMWKNFVEAARGARKYKERYLEIRYEDLLKNGIEVLDLIFKFVGLPLSPEETNLIYDTYKFEKIKKSKNINTYYKAKDFFRKGQVKQWEQTLNSLQRYIFHRVAGDLLCSLKYANGSWWVIHKHESFITPVLYYLSKKYIQIKKIAWDLKILLNPTI